MINFEGDIKFVLNDDGDWDIDLTGGQPLMTDFFDTLVSLYVFGIDNWHNAIVDREEEKMKSRFPGFIEIATVSDSAVSEGRSYLNDCLSPLVTSKIASSIKVDGTILSAFSIRWDVDILRFSGNGSKYSVTWERGFLSLENITNGNN